MVGKVRTKPLARSFRVVTFMMRGRETGEQGSRMPIAYLLKLSPGSFAKRLTSRALFNLWRRHAVQEYTRFAASMGTIGPMAAGCSVEVCTQGGEVFGPPWLGPA